MNCPICHQYISSNDAFCPLCAWDFSDNPHKKQLFVEMAEKMAIYQTQKKELDHIENQQESKNNNINNAILKIQKNINKLAIQKEALAQEYNKYDLLKKQLENLEGKLENYNYVLPPFQSSVSLLYGEREITVTEFSSREFILKTNFIEKPSLMLVLNKKAKRGTANAEYFILLDSYIESRGSEWSFKVPTKINSLEGSYWGFFITDHSITKAQVKPFAQLYQFNF